MAGDLLKIIPALAIIAFGCIGGPVHAENVSDGFAVVIHRSNTDQDLHVADIRAFYMGTVRRWPGGKKLVLVTREVNSPPSIFLLRNILNTDIRSYERRIASIQFQGEEPLVLKVLNSDAAVCRFIFNVPFAIGLVRAASVALPECSAVSAARIDGRFPGEPGYKLK